MLTLFEPIGGLAHLNEHLDRVPRFLFRTYAPRTNGISNDTCMASAAVRNGLNKADVLRREPKDAAWMLENHLLWKDLGNDNLTSWTSSLLWCLQHAIRRSVTDKPRPSLSDIHVCVLSTRKVPRGTFLPAVALLKAFGIPDEGKLKHDYYRGEYLSQGEMNMTELERPLSGTVTTLQNLIDHGLYELYPPFADEDQQTRLWLRVNDFRETFKQVPAPPTPIEIDTAYSIAHACFLHTSIRPVVMAALLSLKPRARLDPTLLETFAVTSWGKQRGQKSTPLRIDNFWDRYSNLCARR